MNEIRMYVEHLFEGRTLTPEVIELKEEIYANLVARYEDYIASGMSEAEALERTKASMPSVDGVLDGTVSLDQAATTVMPSTESQVDKTTVMPNATVSSADTTQVNPSATSNDASSDDDSKNSNTKIWAIVALLIVIVIVIGVIAVALINQSSDDGEAAQTETVVEDESDAEDQGDADDSTVSDDATTDTTDTTDATETTEDESVDSTDTDQTNDSTDTNDTDQTDDSADETSVTDSENIDAQTETTETTDTTTTTVTNTLVFEDDDNNAATLALNEAVLDDGIVDTLQAFVAGSTLAETDATVLSALVEALPLGEYVSTVAIDTDGTTIEIEYTYVDDDIDGDAVERAILYDATALLSATSADSISISVHEDDDPEGDVELYLFERTDIEAGLERYGATNSVLDANQYASTESWISLRNVLLSENCVDYLEDLAELD